MNEFFWKEINTLYGKSEKIILMLKVIKVIKMDEKGEVSSLFLRINRSAQDLITVKYLL